MAEIGLRIDVTGGGPRWEPLRHWRQDPPPEEELIWLWDGACLGIGVVTGGTLRPMWAQGGLMYGYQVRAWARLVLPDPPGPEITGGGDG